MAFFLVVHLGMEYFIVGLVAFGASMLTFFSGFGLGTLMTPVFAVFFDVEVAVAMTGVVHLLNNVFKVGLVYRSINWPVFIQFGAFAFVGSAIGSWVLSYLVSSEALYSHSIFGELTEVGSVSAVIGMLMILFSILELSQFLKSLDFGKGFLWFGGVLSGFFGGLSGHQGALRSVFLVKSGLTKEGYIATGILIACVVDLTRIPVYYSRVGADVFVSNWEIIITAILCAFGGAFLGKKFLTKIKLHTLHVIVATMIMVVGILLLLGVL